MLGGYEFGGAEDSEYALRKLLGLRFRKAFAGLEQKESGKILEELS